TAVDGDGNPITGHSIFMWIKSVTGGGTALFPDGTPMSTSQVAIDQPPYSQTTDDAGQVHFQYQLPPVLPANGTDVINPADGKNAGTDTQVDTTTYQFAPLLFGYDHVPVAPSGTLAAGATQNFNVLTLTQGG